MRPTRLELEGFASFRQLTTIDFTDVDLFVLSGPTGAGKSSVIDAMIFSLYGIVPRYDDKRLVEPVISKGRNEARVRLHFLVNGVGHTAVRVVRRVETGGATTKEARLERWRGDDPDDAVVLAGTAKDVNTAVEKVLGLSFEHFTRTVVLPQGAFQQFLHGGKAERAGLLNELLDVGVFDRVATAARSRASTLAGEMKGLQARLEGDLQEVTDQQVTVAQARVDSLAADIATIEDGTADLEEILQDGKQRAATVTTLQAQRTAVGAITRPDDLDAVLDADRKAREVLQQAQQARDRTGLARDEADKAVEDLPSTDAVTAQQQRVARLAKLEQDLQQQATVLEEQAAAVADATTRLEAAETTAEEAAAALEDARRSDLVATVAQGLHVGDDCPVCARPLDDELDIDAGHVEAATQALKDARQQVTNTRKAAQDAQRVHATATARAEAGRTQLDSLADELASSELPTASDELKELAEQVAVARRAQQQARKEVKDTAAALDAAAKSVDEASKAQAGARQALTRARDSVADQQPPAVDVDDLAGSWDTLLEWSQTQTAALDTSLQEAQGATKAARAAYMQALADLRGRLRAGGVDLEGANTAKDLERRHVTAHHEATSALKALVERQQQRAEVHAKLQALRTDQAVATQLGKLLDKRNFQQWFTTRAVRRLVHGASVHLDQLTNGNYSLTLDDGDSFSVIDHTNGDQVRPARTLSGGETFLASLSLALALSESVADLAAEGAARLESLFIDEGFGTLDASTIDVVRTALEELGSTGRMVGVVTHVPALAEQLPVQFQVRKQAQTSTIERVDL